MWITLKVSSAKKKERNPKGLKVISNTVTYDFPCKLSDTSKVTESDTSFLRERELGRVTTTAPRTAHYLLPVTSTTYPRTVVAIIYYCNTLLLC